MSKKNKMVAYKKGDRAKWIIIFVLVFALILGFAAMAVVLNRQITTYDLTRYSYEIGGLDETGAEVETNASVRTKNFYSADGLTVTVSDELTVTYELFFYDTDKEYVSSTGALAVDYAGTIPDTAEYVRVVITPDNDEDGVTSSEITGYVAQVTVTVSR